MSWHSASVISWAAHFKKLAMVKTFFSTPLTSPPSKLGGDGNNYAAMTYIGYQRLKVALPDFGELTRSSLLSKKYGDRVGKVNIAVNLLNP